MLSQSEAPVDSVGLLWRQLRQRPIDVSIWSQLFWKYQQDQLTWQAGYGARQLKRLSIQLAPDVAAAIRSLELHGDFDADKFMAQSVSDDFNIRISSFIAWLQSAPGDWLTWLYLARLLELEYQAVHQSNWPKAEEALARAVQLEPIIGESLHWLGVWRLNAGDVSGSLSALSGLLDIRPVRHGSMMFLGEALLRNGQRLAAEKAFSRASLSNNPVFLRELSQRVYHHNYWNEALEILTKALQIQPMSVPTLSAMATIHWDLYNLDEVRRLCERILELDPNHGDIGYMLSALPGRMGDAKGHFEAVQAKFDQLADPTSRLASSIAMASLYQDDLTAQEIADLHRRLVRPIETSLSPAASLLMVSQRADRLRIGIVSGDFHRQHPVNLFMLPILQRLDRTRHEIFVYYTGAMQDEYTLMTKSCCDYWLECSRLDDNDLMQKIRGDDVNILLDLAGHTSGHRLGVFALRSAPVQITFLGYPHSTGLSSIDWLIGDRWVSPAEHHNLFSEGLAQLPGCVFCWSPVDVYPLPPPRPPGAPVVFGSFNNVMKLTPRTIRLWARILHMVPNSKLLLKAPSLKDRAVADRFRLLFRDHHIESSRLEFQGPTELGDMMQCYGQIDIALDPTPYNGGTTSLQALWMGVPLVCLLGDNFVSRMGASFLHSLGRSEWLAHDEDEYVNIACGLAQDIELTRSSRPQFRELMAASSLCDIHTYVTHFQELLDRMWLMHLQRSSERILVLDRT